MFKVICALVSLVIASGTKYIRTPAGLWPEDCVHTVPDGTKISHSHRGVHYTYPDGSRGFRHKCHHRPHPDLPRHGRTMALNRTAPSTVESHGYPVIFWGSTDSPVTKFTANYNVPEAPATFAGQTIFWWLGVEPQSASDVLQPVLGYNGFGSPSWTYASWNCCPAGHQHTASVLNVSTGDSLYASLQTTGGDGYTVLSEYNGQQSVLQSNDEIPQVMPLLSMEIYDADCTLLPQSCMTMNQIDLQPQGTFGANEPQGFGLASTCGWTLKISDTALSACPPSVLTQSIAI